MRGKKLIKKGLKNNKALLQRAKQFGLVGNPTRMKIYWLLYSHPKLYVGEIADMLGISISAASHSLKRLRENNLVRYKRDYKQVFYSLSDTSFNRLLKKSLTNL